MDLMSTAQLLGNLGEFVGAIAVVITLAYLAIQIRRSRAATEANTKHLQSAALRDMTARMESRALLLASDSEFAGRVFRSYTDSESLTDLDRFQLGWYLASWVTDFEEAYRQYSLGTIPEAALNSRTANMAELLQFPGAREVWNLLLLRTDPDFSTWANSTLNRQSEPRSSQ